MVLEFQMGCPLETWTFGEILESNSSVSMGEIRLKLSLFELICKG